MTKLIVSIKECGGEYNEWRLSFGRYQAVNYDDLSDLVSRTIKTHFGKTAFFWSDSTLKGYGQIVKPIAKNSGMYSCLTGRVRINYYKDSVGWENELNAKDAERLFNQITDRSNENATN